jgi:hypothetical protein
MFDGAWARKDSIYGLDQRPPLLERVKDPQRKAGTPHTQPFPVGFLQGSIGGDESHTAKVSHQGIGQIGVVAPIATRPSHRTACADCPLRSTRRKRSSIIGIGAMGLQPEECRTCSLDGVRTSRAGDSLCLQWTTTVHWELRAPNSNDAHWKQLRHFLVVVGAALARRKLGPVRWRTVQLVDRCMGVSVSRVRHDGRWIAEAGPAPPA